MTESAGEQTESGVTWGHANLLRVAVASLLVTIGAAAWHELSVDRRLEKLQNERLHLINLQKSLLDCQTGVRGYLLAADERYLQPVVNCRRNTQLHLMALRENKGLRTTVSAFMDDIRKALEAVSEGRETPNHEKLWLSKGIMDSIRSQIIALESELEKDLEKARSDSERVHSVQLAALLGLLGYLGWLYKISFRSSRELAQRLQLERAIWTSSGDALVLYDLDTGIIVDANDTTGRLLGVEPAAMVGRHWREFIADADQTWAGSRVAEVGSQAQSPLVGELTKPDGRHILVEAAMSAEILMGDRRLSVSSFRDLSAREEALQDTALRRAIESVIPSGLAAISDKGEQIYVNNKLCEMVGWKQEELVGATPPFPYWPPEERGRIDAVFKDAMQEKLGSGGEEIRLMRRSGERFPAQIVVSRIESGSRPGWMAFVLDLTEKKKIQTAMEELRRLEAVGQLAGQVAHDFNNLLAIISLNVRLARQCGDDKADLAECIDTIDVAATRGANITTAMLAIARRQPLQSQKIELGEQLGKIRALLLAAAGPEIAVEINPASEPIWIEVDPGGLTAAILNLVVNARDAMPDGGTLRVRVNPVAPAKVGAKRDQPVCVVEVSDTGGGMAPDVKARAFEPFFSTKKAAGTGLGLAMVYGFVKQSGGDAEIDSEPGRGTTIRLFIPTCPSGQTEVSETAQPGTPEIASPEKKWRVLVVDDEPDLLQALGATLSAMGYEVTLVSSAEPCFALLQEQTFDVLLTDILMPGIGGIELAETVARFYPEILIVLMTGFGMRPAHEKIPWPVLEKPFDPEVITALLRRKLGTRISVSPDASAGLANGI